MVEQRVLQLVVKRCPICGGRPWLQTKSLTALGGIEFFLYFFECSKCGIIRTEGVHTYDKSKRSAMLSAAEEWNNLVDEANGHLAKK